jgi:hypothetical protein
MNMTALEMGSRYKWAALTVTFNFGTEYHGHVTVEGQTRIVRNETSVGSAVWVGPVCLTFDTIVCVEPIGLEGAKVSVHRTYQEKPAAA